MDTLGVRGWPLLVLVSLVSLGVAAQGSPRPAAGDGVRRIPPAELTANIVAGLQQIPRPARAFEQRFTVRAAPALEVPLGPYRLQLSAQLPEVGHGAVGVDLEDARGEHRRLHVSVTRHLRAVLPHAAVALSPGVVLTTSHVVLDTTWVERSQLWDRVRAVANDPFGWTVQRRLEPGALLCQGDLRRSPQGHPTVREEDVVPPAPEESR